MTSLNYRSGIAVIALLLLLGFSVAQDYRGKVQGSVTDEAGASVPGAQVVLRDTQTGVDVTRQSDDDGHYIFDFVERAVTQLLREASPINYIHSGLPPFLLVHGTADISVPYGQSLEFRAKLKAAGGSCDLITIDDGVHGMAPWANDPTYKNEVVKWISERLSRTGPKVSRRGQR